MYDKPGLCRAEIQFLRNDMKLKISFPQTVELQRVECASCDDWNKLVGDRRSTYRRLQRRTGYVLVR
jgi:hypothetical protein